MIRLPKGYVRLTDAFNAAGRERFGEHWIGGQLHELAKKNARYQRASFFLPSLSRVGSQRPPPPSPKDEEVWIDYFVAGRQASVIAEIMQAAFVGTPPTLQDAQATFIRCRFAGASATSPKLDQ